MSIKIVSCLFFVILSFYSFGQEKLMLTATVTDKSAQSIVGATVTLLQANDSNLLTGAYTNANGIFELNAPVNKYILKITYLGYQDYYQNIQLNSTLNLGKIVLSDKSTLLKQVTIIDKIPPAKQLEDTTQFNAAAFKVNPDASVEDLLTKLPGVSTQDGKLQAQGEEVKQVLVDGKPFFGDDPNVILKNLPAELIDKIQVFDKKSDQAQFTGIDDGNSVKTINIVTKAAFKNGVFGKAYGGYGDGDKYKAGATVNSFKNARKFSVLFQANNINEQNFSSEDLVGVASQGGGRGQGGGRRGRQGGGGQGSDGSNFLVNNRNGINTTQALGLNYANEWGKLNLSTSYFLNYSSNSTVSALNRSYFGADGLSYQENAIGGSDNYNHRVNIRAEYKIDSTKSFVFQPRFSFQQNDGFNRQQGQNQLMLQLANSSNTNFTSELSGLSFNAPLLYRQSFAKKGRNFTLNINPGYNSNKGLSELAAINITYQDTTVNSDSLLQNATLDKAGTSLAGSITYTEPIAKDLYLQVSYNANLNSSNSERLTYNQSGSANDDGNLDAALSNAFESRYYSQSLGTDVRYQTKAINFNVGLNYQKAELNNQQLYPSNYNLSRDFTSLLPNARLQINFSPKKNLRINYRARNNAPSIEQLQETVNNSNPLQLYVGNSQLKQDLQNNLNLRYSDVNTEKATSLFVLLNATITQQYLSNAIYTVTTDSIIDNNYVLSRGAQLSKPINLDGYQNLRALASYGFYVKKLRSNINLNLGSTYSRNPSMVNRVVNYTTSYNNTAGWSISSNISAKVDFTLSSNSSVVNTNNPLQANPRTSYFNQNSRIKVNLMPSKKWVLQQEVTHQYNSGLSGGFNQNFVLWNAAVGYKFLKEQQAELRLSVYDILNTNTAVGRSITETYLEDSRSNVLQRYLLLTFIYNFRQFRGE